MNGKPPTTGATWVTVSSRADLPTVEKMYWCRMPNGKELALQWRDGNWVTWTVFHHPNTDPLTLVVAYTAYQYKSPQTPDEKREYDRKRRREAKERYDRDYQEWLDAGRPRPKLLKRKKREAA
jgi:hypothetical protein